MVDSPQHATEWMKALAHNQHSIEFGEVNEDGFWRDSNGNVVESSGGTGESVLLDGKERMLTDSFVLGGPLQVAKGMMNAVARVRGKGGF